MPGKVKVKIVAGRNLPIMDRSNDTTDAYVEIKLGSTTFKTDVCRKSLNPQWNSEWFRFEMDDLELQDEPLQIRLMDHDTYSANDAIGKVYLDLNPLLLTSSKGKDNASKMISGWIPVYDTMHGIRGEVNLLVKVELFSDVNKFRQSSCGVMFFFTQTVPEGFTAQSIHGFVEELVVNDDPEYQWIDKIRTPRASNEARQTLFSKLSGEVQRRVGLKALELGGNAVIGYRQCFDLEGESGIVVRGIGTAVSLIKQHDNQTSPGQDNCIGSRESNLSNSACKTPANVTNGVASSTSKSVEASILGIRGPNKAGINDSVLPLDGRRPSDSELGSAGKGPLNPTTTMTLVSGSHGKALTFAPVPLRRLTNGDHFDMLEYPFITLTELPPGFIHHLGGTVSARSVKLLERITNLEEPESRDSWWTEIRMEIRSHARSIGCNVVLGYEEHTTMCDDVCVLSASGTAAIVAYTPDLTETGLKSGGDHSCHCVRSDRDKGCPKCVPKHRHSSSDSTEPNCSVCHIPYNESSVPFPVNMTRCLTCRRGKVPDILLATIDLPRYLPTCGKSCLIQAQVFRPKKDCKGEVSAKEVSDSLPFLEYELHRRLINKLKVRGMNAIFALQVQICLGEKLMVGLATGTAVFLTCLPIPSVPKISAGNFKSDSQKVAQFQKVVQDAYDRNREVYNLKQPVQPASSNGNASVSSDGEDSEDDLPDIDLASGNKDTYVLEVDDAEDIDIIQVLIDTSPELSFHISNINSADFKDHNILSQQMFSQVWRCRLSPSITLRQFTSYFDKLLKAVTFKLRRISPCVLSKLQYKVELPEQDEMQLSIIGMAIRVEKKSASDIDEQNGNVAASIRVPGTLTDLRPTSRSPVIDQSHSGAVSIPAVCSRKFQSRMYPKAKCVEITPLPIIPGKKIDKYIGNLNFFFIRETTSIRENGGLSGFVHSFIAEVLAIVRAHVGALGGNAMVSYFMTELSLLHNPHKNQGQCLVNVGGDVVQLSHVSSCPDACIS